MNANMSFFIHSFQHLFSAYHILGAVDIRRSLQGFHFVLVIFFQVSLSKTHSRDQYGFFLTKQKDAFLV